jgi:4-hydroxy-tetrahydrodipicolinate synthase
MFTGSIVAIVTPMQANGDIDYKKFETLVDWHLDNDTDGFVVLGTTGECPTIEADERVKITRQIVDQVNGRVPVIVGTGTNSTRHSLELTEQAMELGADAALLVTPYYNKPTQEGLYQHFKTIAEAVPIPQILYNVPSRTACDLLPETVLRLTKFSNIVGVKEATGDIERVKILSQANNELDLLSGDDKTAMEFMLNGGKGVISVVANVVPKEFHQLCVAAIAKKRDVAQQLDRQLEALHTSLFVEGSPIPTKWALTQMKMIAEGIRLPLTVLNEKYHEQVRQAMRQAGLKI